MINRKRLVVSAVLLALIITVLAHPGAVSAGQTGSGSIGTGAQISNVEAPVYITDFEPAKVSSDQSQDFSEAETTAAQPTQTTTSEQPSATVTQPSAVAAPAVNISSALFKWDNFAAQLLSSQLNQYDSSTISLYLYMRVVNNTDKTLTLKPADVMIGDVSVSAAGIYNIAPGTDTGTQSQEFILIIPNPDNDQAGISAIKNAESIRMTLILKDSSSQEELSREDVTIMLNSALQERNAKEIINDPGTGDSIPSGNTSSDNYRTLKLYDKGEDVKRLQEKLIEEGYLNDKADGSYGPNTAAAVKTFNQANGLGGGETADAQTQQLLLGPEITFYTESGMVLEIGSQFEWEPVEEDNSLFFRIQVTNHSGTRTIRGYELVVFTTDVWGTRLEDGNVVKKTMTQKIGPGETLFSDLFYLWDLDKVDKIWVGLSRIVFTDGEIRENSNMAFYPCELPTRIIQ